MAIEVIHLGSGAFGDLLTAPGSNNTKADWTELVASSSFAADSLGLVMFAGTTVADCLVDIATGAAASESVILENIPYGMGNTTGTPCGSLILPISIASGSRVSARYQASTSTMTMRLAGYLMAKDTVAFHECTSSVTYGANTTDSGGAGVDPGGSANTKGVYTELSASTSADIKWLVVGISNQINGARSGAFFLVDIATGAESSESVVVPDLFFAMSALTDAPGFHWFFPVPIEIASGTRLAVRAASNITDATDRLFDVIVLGFNGTSAGGGGGGGFSAWMG